ncbi:MAG: NAD-dependent deacylase [Pseudomonadota bacterium]
MARIVILTGAGISAESGLGTFRDEDGIWTQYDLEDVATPEGFARNPKLVHDFYNARRRRVLEARPNAAHHALARLEAALPAQVLIVTQNIDDLHEQAGSENLIHMHGELLRAHCTECGGSFEMREDLSPERPCLQCREIGGMRPSVVWFGEMPLEMPRIWNEIRDADLFVSIGTSGNVYPAAAFVQDAGRAGVATLELNLEKTSNDFDESRQGHASVVVPAWVDEVLRELEGAEV